MLAMSDAKMSDSCGYEEARFDESGLAKQTAGYTWKREFKMSDHTGGIFQVYRG